MEASATVAEANKEQIALLTSANTELSKAVKNLDKQLQALDDLTSLRSKIKEATVKAEEAIKLADQAVKDAKQTSGVTATNAKLVAEVASQVRQSQTATPAITPFTVKGKLARENDTMIVPVKFAAPFLFEEAEAWTVGRARVEIIYSRDTKFDPSVYNVTFSVHANTKLGGEGIAFGSARIAIAGADSDNLDKFQDFLSRGGSVNGNLVVLFSQHD